MEWPTTADLDSLVARFRARTLPAAEWTHRAHLAVGSWHVRNFGVAPALERLRDGIRRLNEAHGTPNSDTRGYHETITRAYVTLIAEFLASAAASPDLAVCVRQILAHPLAARDFLLAFYSRELLFSVHARQGWVEPDRAPLRLE